MGSIYSPQTRPPRLSEPVIGEERPMTDAAARDGGQGRKERKGLIIFLFSGERGRPRKGRDNYLI